jgi:L-malate glycosyltransferase
MNKPRILIIENSVAITGAVKSITRTAYDLKEHFDFLFIIPPRSGARQWIFQKGFNEISELPMKEISKRLSTLLYFPYLLINSFRLLRMVRKKRIDLVHVNDLYNLLPVILKILYSKTPYVCHIRFLPDKFPPAIFKFWLKLHLRYAKKIIVVSRFLLNKLPVHPKIIYIPNELPVEDRYPSDLLGSGERSDLYSFLYLANFIEGKGQNYAIEAFSRIHEQLPEWRLRFVGGDMAMDKNRKYRQKLVEEANKRGVGKKIEWRGFTDDVEKEYKEADIVLNFSESESFSITCLEALYYGRPLIATDCGGPAEIIDHEESGLLVQNKNTDAMIKAMLRLALDPAFRKRLGTNARKIVKEKFSLENTSYHLKEVYNFALKNRK